MSTNNKKKPSEKSPVRQSMEKIGWAALFIVSLTLFCKALGYPLIIPLLLFILGVHLIIVEKAEYKLYLHLGLLLALIVFITHILTFYTDISVNFIPVAAIAMLTMLLFNSRTLAFLMAFVSSTLVTLVLHGNMGLMLTYFLGSLTGSYAVREARTRADMIIAGVVISIINVICLLLFHPDISLLVEKSFFKAELIPWAANGVISSLLVAASLKIFETLFGALTNYSLLELSDFNQPLLKRMILEAPGTYHHSLVVSNLAEAAADAIGANSLLTRVGAYYHDIGKMEKPEYFTENQLVGGNKHDFIEPSMSRLVILAHVSEGMELAKKYKLNRRIIDFIPEHHGTSLMYYFYQKQVASAKEGEFIDEAAYRYPGPKPQSRETAITMLADSCEGAIRALDEHTPQNIEETVKKVINNKFIDGQLDECPLTLKEIERIVATFTRILTAMYHGRVKYPEQKRAKNGNHHKKSAEKNTPPPGTPEKNSPENPAP